MMNIGVGLPSDMPTRRDIAWDLMVNDKAGVSLLEICGQQVAERNQIPKSDRCGM
jgi:hypothetical protein